MKSRWSISALCAFFVVVGLAVAGCGSSAPAGSVAVVAGNPIAKRAVDHFMYLIDKQQAAESEGSAVIVPNDPPQFTNCITQAKATYPTLKKETTTQVRTACKALFQSLSGQAMQYLISAYWYQAQAHREGVSVTDADIQKQLATEKTKNGIKSQSQFQALLAQEGLTIGDLEYEIRVQLTEQKLAAKRTSPVTASDIANYYAQHKSSFGTPQTRNMRIVLASSQAKAQAAIAALRSGKSWGVVAKQYSTDPQTKNSGGLLTGVTTTSQDASLTKAAFAAPLNKLEGPIKASFGWYVVQVIKITPANVPTLAQETKSIRTTLTTNANNAASSAVTALAKKNFLGKTTCSKYYAMADCKGYKAPKASSSASASQSATTTTPASTSTSASSSATGSASSSSSTSTTSSSSSG